ncbi:MAG: hypothetical protein NVV63_10145 [Opitutus sp.]|nr:hypothetical protein [Opitutus sp.]
MLDLVAHCERLRGIVGAIESRDRAAYLGGNDATLNAINLRLGGDRGNNQAAQQCSAQKDVFD